VRKLGAGVSGTGTEGTGMGWRMAVADSERNPFALFESAPC
jgi:predicted enzyme related to lactoylglutathione lyase